uniref:DekiORF44 n=1 Tax=Dendrolimus kikuchii nucleopolyhedrovirus TaxID=1219875 RepID=V9LST0_9ABAC|nr:DekiORF44 [Dendrolimus kikuchii nucleopolyhedrovirus]
MAQVKIGQFKFGEDMFNLRYVVDGEVVKFVAKDIASSLKYEDTKKAIKTNVDNKYIYTFDQGGRLTPLGHNALVKQGDPLYLHPSTAFITKEGVIQLIMRSKLPYAVELQAWLLEEVIPQVLCTGKYAPAVAMDTSGVVDKINNLTEQLAVANANLMEANKSLILFANEMIVARRDAEAARKDCETARKETAQLANRMADIAQDVIAKPSDPQLLHSLAVCALGGEEYAFVRPQRRSLQRSLKRLGSNDIVYKSDYVPNAMNVLNRVKEALPRNQFRARHNKITLLDNLTREQLVAAVQSTMTERQIARLNSSTTTTTSPP